MNTRQVKSTTEPESFEILQGKKLINVDITIETVDNVVEYSYIQIIVDINADVDSTIAEYEYNWAADELVSSDVQIKYHERNSSRAQLTVEDWYVYQEELRDYATVDNGVYSLRTEKPVSPI